MDTKLYINDHNLFTLQYILYEYMNNASSVAATIISQSDMTLLDSMTRVTETSLKFTITMVTVNSCNVCVSVCAKILCERSYDRRSERVALVGGESLNNMNQKEVQL